MHDPMTVAFEIKYPWKKYGKAGRNEFERNYWENFAVVWHCDPCKDGSDDSCGWFMRARHGDPATLEKIVRRFTQEWSRQFKLSDGTTAELGLFDNTPYGWPVMSMHAIAINLFFYAAYETFNSRDRAMKFMHDNLCEILMFAENPTDSMHTGFLHKFGLDDRETREDRIRTTAAMVYGWILRNSRPWYRHPRWHWRHWQIKIEPLQHFKRWAFSKCCKCGKGFKWGESPIGYSWDSDGPKWFKSEQYIAHMSCDRSCIPQQAAASTGESTGEKAV